MKEMKSAKKWYFKGSHFEPINPHLPFIHLTPYSLDLNLGKAYNASVALVQDPEAWILLTDGDFMVGLTPAYGHQIAKAIEKHPDTGLFTCLTNRVKNEQQLIKGHCSPSEDIILHRKIAIKQANEHQHGECDELPKHISGFFMLFQKKTWTKVGGFYEGTPNQQEANVLQLDNFFSDAILQAGLKIRLIKGIYGLHYYRLVEGIGNIKHLQK